ncbi:MAG: tripartite tricarboxylate transporter TctB family protein [Pseudomonadota bacterium]
MSDDSDPRIDIALSLFLIVACATVLWETRDIPPGTFEPLGSAPVPQTVAGLIILLCLVVMASAWRRAGKGIAAVEREFALRPLDAGAILVLTIAYVGLMQVRLLDFAPLTAAFLFVAIGFLVRFRLKSLPIVALVALVTGYGCQYIFTRIFVVDLPGL